MAATQARTPALRFVNRLDRLSSQVGSRRFASNQLPPGALGGAPGGRDQVSTRRKRGVRGLGPSSCGVGAGSSGASPRWSVGLSCRRGVTSGPVPAKRAADCCCCYWDPAGGAWSRGVLVCSATRLLQSSLPPRRPPPRASRGRTTPGETRVCRQPTASRPLSSARASARRRASRNETPDGARSLHAGENLSTG